MAIRGVRLKLRTSRATIIVISASSAAVGLKFTVVVLLMAGISVLSQKLELQPGLSIALFPMVILLAALGTRALLDPRFRHGLLAAVVITGFWGIAPNVFGDRTSAGRVAAALRAGVEPGDVVAYCPDQLGPSVSRLLPDDLGAAHLTFPRAAPPQLVDWVDYATINEAAEPEPFAQMLLERAGPAHTVWVVWAPGYRTFEDKCQGMLANLDLARRQNTRPVKLPKNFEKPALIRFPPQTATA